MTTPLDVVSQVLGEFVAKNAREVKVAAALRELVSRQQFVGVPPKMKGPRLSIVAVAEHAKIERELVNQEGCALPGARELIRTVLELLSDYSLRVECDHLREKVKYLEARLERSDSIIANRIVALHKEKIDAQPTPRTRYSAADVRNSARLTPVDKL